MRQSYFITAVGTGIGKTLVTRLLTQQLRMQEKSVMALKPVISGYDVQDYESDTAILLQSMGLENTSENIEAISPWRFALPASPNLAADAEKKSIHYDELIAFCTRAREVNTVLIEGVGGVMVPLNEKVTVLDWMQALGFPAILVTGTYLGSISHTLTALEVMHVRGIPLHAVVINESEDSGATFQQMEDILVQFMPDSGMIYALSRLTKQDIDSGNAPNLTRIFTDARMV